MKKRILEAAAKGAVSLGTLYARVQASSQRELVRAVRELVKEGAARFFWAPDFGEFAVEAA